MSPELSVVEGPYLRDILDQPGALEATLGGLNDAQRLQPLAAALRNGKFANVVLTGMGSSFHALHCLHLRLIDSGIPSLMVEASELLHYQARLLNTKTLIVIVSQSGQSAEVVRLLEENAGRSKVIAITNTPDSPLAKQSDAAVITRAGSEYSVSCKTYVTALMALQWLAEVLCGGDLKRTEQELQEASSAVDAYLLHWKTHAQTLCSELKGIRHLFLVGRGPSLAAVGTGALIIKESDHFPAEGMSSAAFRHGPLDMVNDESFVMIFSGDDRTRSLNRKLLDDVRARRGRANLVCENAQLAPFSLPAAPACVQPILEILPVEMVTLALAAQEGREPGRFEFATKITTTE